MGSEAGFGSGELEPALAEVAEELDAVAEGGDEQVEVTIAIKVGEGGSGGGPALAGEADAGGIGDIGEAVVPEIAIEAVGAGDGAEVEVAEAVAIDITGGDAGAVHEVLVAEDEGGGEVIGEVDTGDFGGESGEAGERRHGWAGLGYGRKGVGLGEGISGWAGVGDGQGSGGHKAGRE